MISFLWRGIALALAGRAIADPIESTISVKAGTIHGKDRNQAGILEYLGVPFASPPVGNLRWKPPQQILKFDEPVNATTFGPSCFNALMPGGPMGGMNSDVPMSEDCLTINIWTGAKDSTDRKPVMVWIYGGGLQFGSSSQPGYNGTTLANEDVIVVSFNYRLGVLGFLGLPDLDQEEPNSGNFGLQDQIAALQWVQENIAKFGGDPDSVTIFGESAGAHSVGLLLASSQSKGLVHRGILESGAFWDSEHGSLQTFVEVRERGKQFQHKMGASSLAQLRSMPADAINNAALWNSSTDPGITAFSPNIDNYLVTAVPAAIFEEGKALPIPILAGFNAEEEAVFLARALPHDTSNQYVSSANRFFGPHANQSFRFYPASSGSQANQSAKVLDGDLVIRQQTFEALDMQALVNGQNCFGYYYTYTSPYSPVAAHAAEISFVFGDFSSKSTSGGTSKPSEADKQMSRRMRSYWTNFAKTGNPNSENSAYPYWPSYFRGRTNFMELGNNISAITTPNLERFDFLRSLRQNGVLPPYWRDVFAAN